MPEEIHEPLVLRRSPDSFIWPALSRLSAAADRVRGGHLRLWPAGRLDPGRDSCRSAALLAAAAFPPAARAEPFLAAAAPAARSGGAGGAAPAFDAGAAVRRRAGRRTLPLLAPGVARGGSATQGGVGDGLDAGRGAAAGDRRLYSAARAGGGAGREHVGRATLAGLAAGRRRGAAAAGAACCPRRRY